MTRGIVERRLERQVGRGGDAAGPIRDHQRQSQGPHLLAQAEQRLRLRAWPRIVEAAEHAGVEPAGRRRVGLEVAEDEQAGAEAQAGKQSDEHHDHGGREALQPLARHAETRRSTPRYGTSASGTRTDPSAAWLFSRRAMIVRGNATPEALSVCTNSGLALGSGR